MLRPSRRGTRFRTHYGRPPPLLSRMRSLLLCRYMCTAGLTWPLPPEPSLTGRLLDVATGTSTTALLSLIIFAASMGRAEAAALLVTALVGLASLVWACQRRRRQDQQRRRAAAPRPGAVVALQAQCAVCAYCIAHPAHRARCTLQAGCSLDSCCPWLPQRSGPSRGRPWSLQWPATRALSWGPCWLAGPWAKFTEVGPGPSGGGGP